MLNHTMKPEILQIVLSSGNQIPEEILVDFFQSKSWGGGGGAAQGREAR